MTRLAIEYSVAQQKKVEEHPVEAFDRFSLISVGQQVAEYEDTENFSHPRLPSFLTPQISCWALGGEGRFHCKFP